MEKEIHEQPKVIRNIVQAYEDQISSLSSIIKNARGHFLSEQELLFMLVCRNISFFKLQKNM